MVLPIAKAFCGIFETGVVEVGLFLYRWPQNEARCFGGHLGRNISRAGFEDQRDTPVPVIVSIAKESFLVPTSYYNTGICL